MSRWKKIKIKQDEQPEEIQGKFSRLQFKTNEEYFNEKNLEKEFQITDIISIFKTLCSDEQVINKKFDLFTVFI